MIRLQRMGRKKSPSYRLVVSEKTRDPQARSLEILGKYDPTANPKIIDLNEERIQHWMSVGAAPSPTVHNLLINAGILSDKKQRSVAISDKRRAKIDEKKAADVEAAAAKEAAEKEKVEAEKASEVPAPEQSEDAEEVSVEAAPEEKKEAQESSAPVETPSPEEKKDDATKEEKTDEETKEAAA